MPKVRRPFDERDRQEDDLIKEQIDILRIKSHKRHDMIAKDLHMAPATWKRRREKPQTFTLPELRRLRNYMEKHGLTLNVLFTEEAS